MAKAKSYKSVSSYLRSHGTNIKYGTSSLKGDEQKAVVKDKQRKVLNNLLPQIENLPMIEANVDPLEGIEQLLARGGTDRQIAGLKDCQKWLKNFRTISITVTAIPQVKTADGLVSYHLHGFKRSDPNNSSVQMIVDAEYLGGSRASEIAEGIAGPDYMFHASSNINLVVPDAAKNRLFFSSEELYAAVPEMRPPTSKPKRRGGIASYRSGGVASVTTPSEPAAPARPKKPPLTPADWRRSESSS